MTISNFLKEGLHRYPEAVSVVKQYRDLMHELLKELLHDAHTFKNITIATEYKEEIDSHRQGNEIFVKTAIKSRKKNAQYMNLGISWYQDDEGNDCACMYAGLDKHKFDSAGIKDDEVELDHYKHATYPFIVIDKTSDLKACAKRLLSIIDKSYN